MNSLQIQIITKNNSETIEATLESVLPLNAKIVVADLGSRDDTLRICEYYNCEVRKVTLKDRSKIRNEISAKANWNLYIEPWETLGYGFKDILETTKTSQKKSYRFKVFRAKTITKEIRFWNNDLLFYNPVYECLDDDLAEDMNGVIYSKAVKDDEIKGLVQEWKKNSPMASEPYYYEACLLLADGKYDEFLKSAELYQFRDRKVLPVTMIRYYCAIVHCLAKGDAISAIRYIMACIAANPLMAEFWCVLGDIYYKLLKDYKKAFAFYENAIFLGEKRLKNDRWPIELEKYREYPQEMRKACIARMNDVKCLGLVTEKLPT